MKLTAQILPYKTKPKSPTLRAFLTKAFPEHKFFYGGEGNTLIDGGFLFRYRHSNNSFEVYQLEETPDESYILRSISFYVAVLFEEKKPLDMPINELTPTKNANDASSGDFGLGRDFNDSEEFKIWLEDVVFGFGESVGWDKTNRYDTENDVVRVLTSMGVDF